MNFDQFEAKTILRDIARRRLAIPMRSGLVGKIMGGMPYVPMSARRLIRASSRLSQGDWLARLAVAAGEYASGGPIHVVELGTGIGISGMYLLAGMSQAGGGHLTSFEGEQTFAELAKYHFERLLRTHSLTNVTFDIRIGNFQQTVARFLRSDFPRVDLAFIDGPRDEASTLAYHKTMKTCMSESGVIVHDDIAWSEEMHRAWSKIRALEKCRTIEFFLGNRPSRGVLLLGEKQTGSIEQYHFDGRMERILRQARFWLAGGGWPN